MEKVTSTTEQKVPIYVTPKSQGGKDVTLDGRPVLEVLAGGATVQNATQEEADADETASGKKGLAGFVVSEDSAGTSSIRVSADADLGEGVRTISDSFDYEYGDPQAEALGTSAGAAVLKA